MLRTVSVCILVTGLAACGGDRLCTATLSGAMTGTYDCGRAGLGWIPERDQFNFSFRAPPRDPESIGIPAVDMLVKFSGEPQPATYTEATAGGEGSISVQERWYAGFANGTTIGTVALRFTSVTEQTFPGGKGFSAAGTLDAVLPAQDGSGSSVTLHATFSSR